MASRRVARLLRDLNDHCGNNALDSATSAQVTVLTIRDVVLQDLTEEEQDLCSQVLFEPTKTSSTDILTEFMDCIVDKRFSKLRCEIIKLVMAYIDHVDKNIQVYAPRIQAAMIQCVNADESDAAKSNALLCLDRIYLINEFDIHAPKKSEEKKKKRKSPKKKKKKKKKSPQKNKKNRKKGKGEIDDSEDEDEDEDDEEEEESDDDQAMQVQVSQVSHDFDIDAVTAAGKDAAQKLTDTTTAIPLSQVISQFYNSLSLGTSIVKANVRGGIMRLLGILSNRYSNGKYFSDKRLTLLSKLYTKYISEALNEPSKMQRGLIAGCLTGLEYFLNEYCDRIPLKPKNMNNKNNNKNKNKNKNKNNKSSLISSMNADYHNLFTVFRIMLFSIRDAERETRYSLVIASLNLLNRHSMMFMQFILPILENSIKQNKTQNNLIHVLLNVCRHHNSQVSECGVDCLESLLAELTGKLCENPETATNKKLFVNLLKTFVTLLTNALKYENTNTREVSLAIRAFGQLAETIKTFKGNETLQQLVTKLISISKRFFIAANVPNQNKNDNNDENVNDEKSDQIRSLDVYGRSGGSRTSNTGFGGETSNSSNNKDADNMMKQFPPFLSAFASIIYHLDTVDDFVIEQLSNMMILIWKGYPKTYSKLRKAIHMSLIRLFVVLYVSQASNFSKLLENVVYKGCVFSITTLDETFNNSMLMFGGYSRGESGIRVRKCFEEYYSLWKGLLMTGVYDDSANLTYSESMTWSKGLNKMNLIEANQYLQEMRSLLFDSFMKQMIDILKSLNLKFTLIGDGNQVIVSSASSTENNNGSNLQLVMNNISENAILDNPNDMELFLNYVEFVSLFLSHICKQYLHLMSNHNNVNDDRKGTDNLKKLNPYFVQFQPWSMVFIEMAIEKSNDNPMISGLYKILKAIFVVFEPSNDDNDGNGGDDDDDAIMGQSNKISVKLDQFHSNLIHKYIENCVTKLQTYRDELLYSCIELLLHIPRTFIQLGYIIPALVRSLKIGLTHMPAAELAVTVLEKWCEEHLNIMIDYLPTVLPHLRPYLLSTKTQVAGISGDNDDDDEDDDKNEDDDENDEKSGNRNNKNKNKNNKKNGKKSGDGGANDDHVDYIRKKRLIRRILSFLGKLGGYNQGLLCDIGDIMSSQQIQLTAAEAAGRGTSTNLDIVAWDSELKIRYDWAFPDLKLSVYLDPLLPRIAELALNSTDRRTKVAACEALHSIIVKMVADNASDPNQRRQQQRKHTEYDKIYIQIFPVLLKLAVSVEQVARQLFRTLIVQLIHWFTQNKDKNNDETMALLDSIADALGNSEDAALRDFGGECMAEFVKWSLKHKGASKGSLNIDSLLRRLYSLIKHPSPHQRFGACLTFEHIYKQIREEPKLVSLFILEILTNLVESLAVAYYDKSGIDTTDETRRCIAHFEKMIVDKKHGFAKILNKIDQNRKGGDHCKCLTTFVQWLFENLGRVEVPCRRQCGMLVESLAPLAFPVQGKQAPSGNMGGYFVPLLKKNKVYYFVNVFEGGRYFDSSIGKSVLANAPKLPQLNEQGYMLKLKQFKHWMQDLSTSLDNYFWALKAQVIPKNSVPVYAKILKPNKIFESYICRACCHFVSNLKELNNIEFMSDNVFEQEFINLKCDVTIRLFRYIDMVLKSKIEANFESLFNKQLLYQLLIECLMVPDLVGFVKNEPQRIKMLQDQFGSALESIGKRDKLCKITVAVIKAYLFGEKSFCQSSNNKFAEKSLSMKISEWDCTNFFQFPGKSLLFLRGAEILAKKSNYLTNAAGNKATEFAAQLATSAFDLCDGPLDPTKSKIAGGMLSIGLRLGLPTQKLVEFLSDESPTKLVARFVVKSNKKERKVDDDDEDDDDDDLLDLGDDDDDEMLSNNNNAQSKLSVGSKGLIFYDRYAVYLDGYFLRNFQEFCNVILFQISKKAKPTESKKRQLTSILTTVLRHILELTSTNTSLESQKQFLTKLIGQFSKNITLDTQNEENVRLHLAIIQQYLSICGDSILKNYAKDKSNPVAKYIVTVFTQSLANPNHFNAQLQALRMLPLFLKNDKINNDENESDTFLGTVLLPTLHKMILNSFPAKSKNVYEQSRSRWKDYVERLTALLDGIVASQSFELIRILVPILREKQHKCIKQINDKLDTLIASIVSPFTRDLCFHFASSAAKCFFDDEFDSDTQDNARRWMVESLCVPILESAPIPVVDKFFIQHKFGKKCYDIISKYPNGPDRTKDHDSVKLQLLDLECAYKLLAVQYERLAVASFEEAKSGVNYKLVIKKAHDHVKKFGAQGKQDAISQVAFHCAAYKCLTRCIIRTQKQGSLNVWSNLFVEKANKGQILWANIIDLNFELILSIDTNFDISKRKLERAMKQNAHLGHGLSSTDMWNIDNFLSQSLMLNSSLKKDFSQMSQVSQTMEEIDQKYNINKDEEKQQELAAPGGAVAVNEGENEHILELDPLNSMPTMVDMLAAIDTLHMYFRDNWENTGVMPKWMAALKTKLEETDRLQAHPNIKWFIAKLIVNKPHVFEPFAGEFFKPLVDLCCESSANTWGFHYFLRDICELFLFKWAKFVPRNDIHDSAQTFINHLISVVADFGDANSKNAKIAQNVNYIKLLLSQWGKHIQSVSKKHLLSLLQSDEGHQKKKIDSLQSGDSMLIDKRGKIIPCEIVQIKRSANAAGEKKKLLYKVKYSGGEEEDNVQPRRFYKRDFRLERRAALYVLDAIVAAGFAVYDEDEDSRDGIDLPTLFKAFLTNITIRNRPVWKTAAQVYGNILRHENELIEENPMLHKRIFSCEQCLKMIKKALEAILKVSSELPKAVELLHRIGNEHPQFLDSKLMQPVLGSIAKVPFGCLTDCISLFARYVSVEDPDPEVARNLRPGLKPLFNHNDSDAHLALCDVFLRLLPTIDHDLKTEFVSKFIDHFKDHDNTYVRRKLYGILSHIRDNDILANEDEKNNDVEMNSKWPQSLKIKIEETLLAALSDKSSRNRKLMFEYWGNEQRLSMPIMTRLKELLSVMFTKSCENLWLHYATFLLMEPMRKSNEFNKEISYRPLSECKFDELRINSKWNASSIAGIGSQSMTPMFGSSIPSQMLVHFSQSQANSALGMIRATQNNIWTQTQQQYFQSQQGYYGKNTGDKNKGNDHLPTPNDIPRRGIYGSGKNSTFLWSMPMSQELFAASQQTNVRTDVAKLFGSSQDQDSEDSENSDPMNSQVFGGSFAVFERGPQRQARQRQQQRMANNNNNNVGSLALSQSQNIISIQLSQRFSKERSKRGVRERIKTFDREKRHGSAWKATQKDIAANSVSLFRSYRHGELPDICIPHSDLQLPLQALHTDPVIAKQLFLMFFEAIYREAKLRSERRNRVDTQIENAICDAIKQCDRHSSVVSTLFNAATQLDCLPIHPRFIADLAIRSNNLYSGVALLEHMLEKGSDNLNDEDEEEVEEPPKKRRRLSKQQEKKKKKKKNDNGNDNSRRLNFNDGLTFKERISSQLSRLYNLLGEHDTVLGLSSEYSKEQLTKDGIAAYLKGDYVLSYRSYKQAMQKYAEMSDNAKKQGELIASNLEKSLWSEESTKCLYRLAQWEDVYEENIDTLEQLPNVNKYISPKRGRINHIERVWAFLEMDKENMALIKKENKDIGDNNNNSNDKMKSDENWMSTAQKQQKLQGYLRDWILSNLKRRDEWHKTLFPKIERWVEAPTTGIRLNMNENNLSSANKEAMLTEKYALLKQAYLEDHYPSILSFLYAARKDFAKCQIYLNKAYNVFLDRWINLPKFADGTRKCLLNELLKLSEIEEFMMVYRMETDDLSWNLKNRYFLKNKIDSEDIIGFWKRRFPKQTDDILIWDDVIFDRNFYGKSICDLPNNDHLLSIVTEMNVETLYNGIVAMISQKNYNLAFDYITQAALLGELNSKIKIESVKLELCKLLDDQTSTLTTDEDGEHVVSHVILTNKDRIAKLYSLSNKLDTFSNDDAMRDCFCDVNALHGQILYLMGDIVQKEPLLSRYCGNKKSNAIYKESQKHYRASVKYFKDDDDDDEDDEDKDEDDENKNSVDEDDSEDDIDIELNGLQDNKNKSKSKVKAKIHEIKDELKYAVDGDVNVDDWDDGDESEINSFSENVNFDNNIALKHHRAQAQAYLELALFCDRRLMALDEIAQSKLDNEARKKLVKRKNYSKEEIEFGDELIENTLLAMSFNSEQARSKFPRVLEVAEMDDKLQTKIGILSKRIPCWMFLRWIAQMLAQLGSISSLGDTVMPILERIARMYPAALIYPFNLTSEDLTFDNKAKKYINKLSQLLKEMDGFELTQTFIEALDCMCHPNMKFKDAANEIKTIRKNHKKLSKAQVREKIRQCIKDLGDSLFKLNKPFVKRLIGTDNRDFIKQFGKEFFKKFGANADKGDKFTPTAVTLFLQQIQKHKKFETFNKAGGKYQLRKWSEWLDTFDSSKYEDVLEVPGQYTGMRRPNPDLHLTIVSFDPTTLVMGSLRKPKRIKIRTNDEREQMWLVKAGEDLRLDQRIEQLFSVINTILVKNTACSQRELSLRTYDVIPLTRSVGVIEWIPNTIPIKALISNQYKKQSGNAFNMSNVLHNLYIGPFAKITKETANSGAMYISGIMNYKRTEKKMRQWFDKCENVLDEHLLQSSVRDMSRDLEAYIQLRNRFGKTLGVFTICGYILGIGDRHLDNYLVDQSSGQVIGIDFGAAFGYGLGLPVPELMPMRLTRQFEHLMDPLDTIKHFHNNMVHTMRALQECKDILLNVMDVFVKEPSLDWVELAQRNFQKSNAKLLVKKSESLLEESLEESQDDNASEVAALNKDIAWYPRHKIEIARLKLNRYNSVHVMIEEIQSTSHFGAKHKNGMIDLIEGKFDLNRGINRKDYPAQCENVESQIECVIHHATDRSIRNVTWQGWASWI